MQRLKNKLGNWANASSEVEYRGALAWMIGEEGRGVPTIIEMVAMTRFDCMVGSSSLMRQSLTQAAHHCAHRQVGGKVLAEQPLMQNAGGPRPGKRGGAGAVHAHGPCAGKPARRAGSHKFARLVTAIGKYWIRKRAPEMVAEASENRRRRLCRGNHPAAPVPRSTGQLDLGRLGQRSARRAARPVQGAGRARCAVP